MASFEGDGQGHVPFTISDASFKALCWSSNEALADRTRFCTVEVLSEAASCTTCSVAIARCEYCNGFSNTFSHLNGQLLSN